MRTRMRILAARIAFLAGAAACLVVFLQLGRPFHLAIGSGEDRYIRGWRNDDETSKEGGGLRYFRWVLDGGRLRLPLLSRGGEWDIRLHAMRHEPGRVAVVANYEEVLVRDFGGPVPWRDYNMTVSRQAAERGPLNLIFVTSPRRPETLALAIDWIDVAPGAGTWVLPSFGLLLSQLAAALFLMLAAERMIGPKASRALMASALAAYSISLYFWKLPVITIASRLWPLFAVVWGLSFAVRLLRENRRWGAAFLLGMSLHGVLYFHPYLYPPDLHYHSRFAEKLSRLPLAEIYKVSIMYDIPGDFSLNYPYSPVFHLITGLLTPEGADVKYLQKLIILVAYGLVGIALVPLSRCLGFGPMPLVLYFLDPTVLRHLYRCHMPGMFGMSLTSIFILYLAVRTLQGIPWARLIAVSLFLAFAMCTYPASFLQLSIFTGLLAILMAARKELRGEVPRMLIVCGIAYALSLLLFYGHYIGLIWTFFLGSRDQVAAAGRSATLLGALLTWWETISLEKAWPFYIPAVAGAVLLFRRAKEARWTTIQTAWIATYAAMVILTCDFLLPSVRVHIKEIAFLTPLLVLYETECFSRMLGSGRRWKIGAVFGFAVLALLSVVKLVSLIRLGFAMP